MLFGKYKRFTYVHPVPKNTTEAAFIKHFIDKTVAFNNQIITCLLVLVTHGCKPGLETLSDSGLRGVTKSTDQSSYFKMYTAVKLKLL